MASRTDKGVHASFSVACVECGKHFKDLVYLKKQINKFSHPHIHIKTLQIMPLNFEVRYEVKAREYRYIFHHGVYNPFMASYVYFYPKINIQKANLILQNFVGKHDFRYLCKSGASSKTTIREVFSAKAYTYKDLSIFHFRANGFLRGQVRLSVASVLKVLENKMSLEELKEQIGAKKAYNRLLAPAEGLYLSKIIY